jgi:alkylation response protein AidB-like acyl-CoA dehydrogenase
MLLPRAYGGGELDPLAYLDVIELLATVDASTAWCIGQSSGCSMSAAYLEPAAASEIFGPRDAVLCWGPPAPGTVARAQAVDGGFRVTGSWTFASGSRHATWLGGQARIGNGDETRMLLFPRARATISDVWQVVGLRGTGSDSYSISDLFVPAHHTYTRELESRRETGPLYAFSIVNSYAIAFAGVALGIARASFEAFVALAGTKAPSRGGALIRESPSLQLQVGTAAARLRAARAFHVAAIAAAWEHAQAEGPPTLDQRIEMRMAATHAIQTAKDVVDVLYAAAGTNAIFAGQPFERRFRDVHAVTQQIQGHLANLEVVGKYLLGLPVELVM